MADVFYQFHTFRDVFLLGRAGSKAKAKTNILRQELMQKRKVDKKTNADTGTLSKKQHEMNARWNYIRQEIHFSTG
jgi:hypothetical protein